MVDIKKSLDMRLLKSEAKHNTAMFVALEPNKEDRNGDVIKKDEVIKTAHNFVKNLWEKDVNFNHEENTETDKARFVESYTIHKKQVVGNTTLNDWTWIIWLEFDDDLFEEVKKWNINWISVEWKWKAE